MPRGRPRIHPPRDPDAPRRPRGRPRGSFSRTGKGGTGPGFRLSPYIMINDQRVTWSFIKYVYKRLNCQWDDTIDAFWKSRHATGANGIYRYIMSGFRPTASGIKWIALPSKERERGQMESISKWWLKLYTPSKTRAATVSFESPEVKNMLDGILGRMNCPV